MIFGILLIFAASISFSASNLIEKSAVDRFPALSPKKSVRMLKVLFTSPRWMVGFAASALALVLTTISLSLIPLAVGQAIFGAGLVPLVIASHVYLGERMSRRELVGIGTIIVAIALVSVSLVSQAAPGIGGSPAKVCLASIVTTAIAIAVLAANRSTNDRSVVFGLASGLIYGVAGLEVKGASVFVQRHGLIGSVPWVLRSPYPYLLALTSILGLVIFQAGIQRGRVIVVAPLTNVVASSYVVAVGMLLFDEPLPHNILLATIRLFGFGLVLLGGFVSTSVLHDLGGSAGTR